MKTMYFKLVAYYSRFYWALDRKKTCRKFNIYVNQEIFETAQIPEGGVVYAGIIRNDFKTVIRFISKLELENFLDLGSGIGTACFLASEYFNSVMGVEFDGNLTRAAKNVAKETKVEFICSDVASFKVPEKRYLLFLYNPFNSTTLNSFLKLNIATLHKFDSVVAIVNGKFDNILEPFGYNLYMERKSQINGLLVKNRIQIYKFN